MKCTQARIALFAIFATVSLATSSGNEPDPLSSPATKRLKNEAEAAVKRNRKAYDDANAKTVKETEKDVEEEVKRLSRAGKPEEAVAFKNWMLEFKKKYGSKGGKPMVGAKPLNGHHYMVVNEKLSWKQAQKWCEDNGGHLVIIEDKKEQDELVQWLTNLRAPSQLFLGATDEKLAGEWLWVDGSLMTFKNWRPNYPAGGDWDYAVMNLDAAGQWEAFRLDFPFPFICEWDE